MPGSFLARHRTICEVLDLIRKRHETDMDTVMLCDEAIEYARRMSKKLTEYKIEKEKKDGYGNDEQACGS